MDRLIRRMGRSPRRVRALAQVRRAAAVALVFLAVGFSGLMVTSQAFRAQVLEVLVQVYEEITNFRFSAEGETDRTAGDFVLTYLPQGMEETVRQSSRIRHYICFEDNAGNMLEVTHIVVGANFKKSGSYYFLDRRQLLLFVVRDHSYGRAETGRIGSGTHFLKIFQKNFDFLVRNRLLSSVY